MDGSNQAPGRRTLTPAVLASALFAACCAVGAITFVAARGGLQMPIAATPPAVALASARPTGPAATAISTAAPSAPTAAPTIEPSMAPTVAPSTVPPPTPGPSAGVAPTLDPSDPLLRLPGCPGLPGCFEYTILRGDSLSGVATRYLLPVSTVLALNPEVTDPRVVVVGHILYLGHDPFVRLPPCPGAPGCSLYTVRPGDRLSTIAGRYGIGVQAILDANPSITDPNLISSGQVIRLPHPA
ncbi:MAG TPA: LysM peptidoglycan-binding domain-containing protein [Candidatus Dormibacteraeota bacterium]|nr:LysM peptidoglycan-binding domain-containing protein [Candidatus Dormibacteraeota bacterium]